jgi:hypothetical protein
LCYRLVTGEDHYILESAAVLVGTLVFDIMLGNATTIGRQRETA